MSAPRRAMVLAAGRGRRMRPLSDTTPKPLIEIAGRSPLERMLDRFAELELVVVNACHLAGRIEEALARRRRPPLLLSREEAALDTGGGVMRALPHLAAGRLPGDAPDDDRAFAVANGDVLLKEPGRPALQRLAAAWNGAQMDALLLLVPRARAGGFAGGGDFFLDAGGRPARRGGRQKAPFVYAGMQLVHPRLFAAAPAGAFSFNLLWDRAIDRGRLRGAIHDGGWFTVDRPAAIAAAERWLEEEP